MQHHPEPILLINAQLDEVISSTQRAEMTDRTWVIRFGVPLKDLHKAILERLPRGDHFRGRVAAPGTDIIAPAVVAACGMAASIAERSGARLSGSADAVTFVRTAAMPQPISTPTAAGIIAPTLE